MIALPISIAFKALSLFGLSDRLAKKLAPLALVAAVLLLIVLAIVGFRWWLAGVEDEAEQQGRTAEREAVQQATIEQVEQANAVRNEIERQADRRSGSDLYAVCLQSARNPAQCEQFLPQ